MAGTDRNDVDPTRVSAGFFTHAIDLLCVADLDGTVRAVNPAWERVLGWTPRDLHARPYLDLVHPDDAEFTRQAVAALARGERMVRYLNRVRHRSGGYRHLEWCAVVEPAEGLIYATARDVTEASRDAMHRAEIEAVTQVGSWEVDLESGEVYWSAITHALHETDPATFRPSIADTASFFPPEAQALLEPAFDALRGRGEPFDLEVPFTTARGRHRWLRVTSAAERRDGRVTRAFGTLQDVTARRGAEEALRISEERHRLALIAAAAGIIDWDLATGVATIDPTTAQLLGLDPALATLRIDAAVAAIHPQDRPRVDAALAAAARPDGPLFDLRFRYHTPPGAWIWLRVRGKAITRAADGTPLRAIGTIVDITVAEQASAERARRSERLDQLLSASPATVYAADVDTWRLTYVSPNCRELFGAAPEAILTDPQWWAANVHPEELASTREVARRWYAAGAEGILRHSYRIRGPKGAYIWVEDSLRLIRDAAGAPLEFAGAFIDVTSRHRHEEAILAARNRLQATLDAIPDVLFELDADGRFASYHARSPEHLSLPPGAFLGHTLDEVLPPAVAEISRTAMREALEHGRSSAYPYEFPIGGQTRWYELTAARRLAEDLRGRPGYVILTRDITARHRAEVELRAARERAELASAAKSSFLANMSHEIRTPMNGLLGMVEVLERVITEPEHRRHLAVLRDSGEGLLTILNDILDVSKIEAGKVTLETVAFRPCDLVRKIESIHRFKALERGLPLTIAVSPCAERPRIGDSHRILQILHNLVSNAIKFTSRGAVRVTLECTGETALVIDVEDTGIGMTPEQVARIFADYEQADPSVTRRYGGTGLGMSIVRRLTRLMGGEITIESRPAVGTHVRVSLPLPYAEPMPEASTTAASAPAITGLRVLAVDDNEINRMVLEAMLADLAVQAVIVESGREAIARVEAATFDVLLIDISMPEMDGIETLQAIRAVERRLGRPPARACAVTANAYKHQVDAYLAAGFDAHLAKPIRVATLAASLVGAPLPE